MKIRIMLFIVFVLLVSACAAPSTPQPIDTLVPTIEATSTPEPTLPPVQTEPAPTTENVPVTAMTTYTDNFAGFSIDYPAGWYLESSALAHVEESFSYSISFASWDTLHPPTPGGKDPHALPEGGTKFDVTVVKGVMTLEEAVAQFAQSGSPILAREDVTLPSGLAGAILDFEGFAGLARTLVVPLNENVIYVTGYGNLENFEAIALTLRAMKTYTDNFAGFSLDYPADWFLEASALAHAQESFAYSVSVASWDILHPPAPTDKDPDKLPPGGAKIDVNVMKQSMTLEEAVTQQGQSELGTPILARKDVTLANGLPAVILDLDSPIGPIRTLITILNGNVIYVSGYGDLENYEAIALSLRAR